jgi:hypothetical protein
MGHANGDSSFSYLCFRLTGTGGPQSGAKRAIRHSVETDKRDRNGDRYQQRAARFRSVETAQRKHDVPWRGKHIARCSNRLATERAIGERTGALLRQQRHTSAGGAERWTCWPDDSR